MGSRVTINEIARRSGVSKGAVSYALNGRPGVSASTRERILGVARELGWAPNRTARLLSGSRTDTFGLVLTRDPRTLATEPFYLEFVAGVESVLSPRSYALLVQLTNSLDAELELYRRWASERRVDAVAVVDVRLDDPRVQLMRELDLPVVFVGDPSMTDGHTCVWTDDARAMDEAVSMLAGLGHRRITRVAGVPDFAHVHIRDQAFAAAAARLGVAGTILHPEVTAAATRETIRALARSERPPTALLFDDDLMAATSLAALQDCGLDVPGQMSVLAWNDTTLCEITSPQLCALTHDVMGYGATVGWALFGLLDGASPAAHLHFVPQVHRRGSTGPPPEELPTRPRDEESAARSAPG